MEIPQQAVKGYEKPIKDISEPDLYLRISQCCQTMGNQKQAVYRPEMWKKAEQAFGKASKFDNTRKQAKKMLTQTRKTLSRKNRAKDFAVLREG